MTELTMRIYFYARFALISLFLHVTLINLSVHLMLIQRFLIMYIRENIHSAFQMFGKFHAPANRAAHDQTAIKHYVFLLDSR